jgi:hypothetical protein
MIVFNWLVFVFAHPGIPSARLRENRSLLTRVDGAFYTLIHLVSLLVSETIAGITSDDDDA